MTAEERGGKLESRGHGRWNITSKIGGTRGKAWGWSAEKGREMVWKRGRNEIEPDIIRLEVDLRLERALRADALIGRLTPQRR